MKNKIIIFFAIYIIIGIIINSFGGEVRGLSLEQRLISGITVILIWPFFVIGQILNQ